MTSTTYNRSAAHATDESKTESSNVSPGETLDLNRGRGKYGKGSLLNSGRGRKGAWLRLALVLNDLLPNKVRIVKSKRARYRRWYGWRTQLLSFRINWRGIHRDKLMNKLGLRHGK
jgi:hypothetical protein